LSKLQDLKRGGLTFLIFEVLVVLLVVGDCIMLLETRRVEILFLATIVGVVSRRETYHGKMQS
jgi:hypothetical protein